MGLFDSLRSKLKGVSKKLESEVEKQLGDQLERELAAAVKKDTGPPSAPPTPPLAPVAPGVPREPTRPAPPPASTGPIDAFPPMVERQPPTPEPAQPPSAPPAPAPLGDVTPFEAPSAAGANAAPSTAPPAIVPAVPTPTAPPAPRKPTGRKMLSESEIETRLARELTEAVTVQKAVEETVRAEAPATRFTVNESVLEDILWDLEVGLLESDVALPVIEAIKGNVKEQLLTLSVGGKAEEVVEKVLRTAIQRVLQVNPLDFDDFVRGKLASGKRPVVVMFVGVNGTGKTTSIGRVAYRLKEQGISCVMAAGDTFRAGAIEQLSLHGERLGVTVVKHKAGADPAAVAYDAIEHAKARHKDVVLLDTAGRMQNNSN
ncbi:MAG: signal recognition particle receptor subunit alpha, partial [Thermoplasmatota archaeon]